MSTFKLNDLEHYIGDCTYLMKNSIESIKENFHTPHTLKLPVSKGEYVWLMVKHLDITTTGYSICGYDHMGPKFTADTKYTSYIKIEKQPFKYALLDKYKISELYLSKEDCEQAYFEKYGRKYQPYIKNYPLGNSTPSEEIL